MRSPPRSTSVDRGSVDRVGNPATSHTYVLDFITQCGQVLDEANIPESGRWMVIPSWMASLIKQSDLRNASIAGDMTSVLRNGRLGEIDRFTLYYSNLLPTVDTSGPDSVTSVCPRH